MSVSRSDSETRGASPGACPVNLDVARLRQAVQAQYAEVAIHPAKGFHFHTGWPLVALLGYDPAEVHLLPDGVAESFAGVGNPFIWRRLRPGEFVVDVESTTSALPSATGSASAIPSRNSAFAAPTKAALVRPLASIEGVMSTPTTAAPRSDAEAGSSRPNATRAQLEELCQYVQDTSPVHDILANPVPVKTDLEVI